MKKNSSYVIFIIILLISISAIGDESIIKKIKMNPGLYRERLGFVNFGDPQSGSDLHDREEGDIESISPTSDRSKMGRYDGPKNSQNLTARGIYLNSQDVPIFYEGNPLEGLSAFAVIPPYSIQNPEVNKQVELIIEKELGSIGTVIKAKSEDPIGFGSGNLLNIQVGSISKWNGGELPISRVTLSIETPVMITKTNIKSLPRVWSINDFVDAPFNIESEDKILGAVRKLLKEFTKNYKFANPTESQKPTFYIY